MFAVGEGQSFTEVKKAESYRMTEKELGVVYCGVVSC